ncbi:hypothetical protein H5125_09735 [Shewanella sp. SR44-4]|uniref:DUF7450 family protein n=1 Tax=unclassified Shewanella TaxID=196818 RepID=UPI000C340A4C|nr:MULTISPECIES: hypothetical protein [unclassified Shewanella]MBB1362429.1 hypothetical protein [Shewanella sp. SR44-4]PKH31127.1 hypothetical protein CXF88_14065 [Shewanella sp. ALD9]
MSILKKTLISMCLMSASTMVAATPITANVTADNDFIVVHSPGNGSTPTVVYRGANGSNWKKIESFKFDIDSSPQSLETCSVSVIAWGDGQVSQGMAAIFKGDNTIYTGSGHFKAYQSTIPSSGWAQTGGPNTSQINTLIAGSLSNAPSPYLFPGSVAGGTSPWGTMNFPLASNVNANNFRWAWSTSNLAKKTYSVFTAACGDIVKEIPVAVDMPGEHFQCYGVQKGDALREETIMIEDQFGKTRAVLGKPVLLCNPSSKIHNDKMYKIRNEKRHMVCYDLIKQSKVRNYNLEINNQFAPDQIVNDQRELFCVPSSKKHLKPVKPGKPGKPIPREMQRAEMKPLKQQ